MTLVNNEHTSINNQINIHSVENLAVQYNIPVDLLKEAIEKGIGQLFINLSKQNDQLTTQNGQLISILAGSSSLEEQLRTLLGLVDKLTKDFNNPQKQEILALLRTGSPKALAEALAIYKKLNETILEKRKLEAPEFAEQAALEALNYQFLNAANSYTRAWRDDTTQFDWLSQAVFCYGKANKFQIVEGLLQEFESEIQQITVQHSSYLKFKLTLSLFYVEKGDYDKALSVLIEAETLYEPLGIISAEYTSLMRNIGDNYRQKSQYNEALVYYKRTETLLKQRGVEDACLWESLANLYHLTGKYYLSFINFQKVKQAYIDHSIDLESPRFASLYQNWGNLYSTVGYFKLAIISYEEAISGYLKVGNDSVPYGNLMLSLGNSYNRLRQHDEGDIYYEKAEECLKILGRDHHDYRNLQLCKANSYMERGLPEKALEISKQQECFFKESDYKSHDYADYMMNLGSIYSCIFHKTRKQEDFKNSLEAYDKAKIFYKTLGEKHIDYVMLMKNYTLLHEHNRNLAIQS